MTSFYGNQGGGANGLGVSDRFPWQGPVGPSGSAQGIPNLGALSQQANTPNIFQEQLSNPSRGLADVDGIQNALQQFQSQPKTVMASDMDDTEFKFRNLAAKYAAQDNSKSQQSSTGEDNGVSYKTRDEDHATGPDAWASLGKFMKTAEKKQEEKTAGVIGGLGDLWNVGKSVRKGLGTGLSYLSGKPLTATSFTAGAGGDIIGEEAYDALGWGPKAPVDPKAPVKPRGLGKLWQSDRSTTQNLEEFWRRGFRGFAAGTVGNKRFIPAVRASAQQKQRNFLKGFDPDIAKGLPQVPGTGEYMSGVTDQMKPKLLALGASEIPRLYEYAMKFTGSHADAAENIAKGTEKAPDVMSNIDRFTRWSDLPRDDPKRSPGAFQQAIETASDAAAANREAVAQAGESITKPITDRFDLAFPNLKPPVEGAAPAPAPVPGTPQEPSRVDRALTAGESVAESLESITGGQGSAGGGDGKPTGDGSTGDSNASTVKILTDSATSIGNFMNTANKWLPWVAGGTVGVGGLYALYKVFESRRRDREEKERRALLHAMPLGYKAAAEKQAILVAPWEGTELTPYQYGFAVRVHEANLSPQQIRDGIEKVAEYMGEEYAEELREGMEKIALPVPGLSALGRGAWNVGSNLIRKKIPQWLGRGGAQATQQAAKQAVPQAAQQAVPKVTKMKNVGTSLADIPKSPGRPGGPLYSRSIGETAEQAADKALKATRGVRRPGRADYARNVESLASRGLKPGPHAPGGGVPKPMWQGARAGRHHIETTVDDLIRNAAQQAKAPVSGAFRAGQQVRRGLDATKAAPGQLWNATKGYTMPPARMAVGGMTGYNMSGDDATMGETARNTLLGAGMGFNMPTLKKHLPSVGDSAMGMFYGSGAGEGLDELNRWRDVDSNYGQSLGWGGAGLGASKNKIINPLFNRFMPQTVKNRIPAKAMPWLTGTGIAATEAPELAALGRSMYDSSTGGTGVPPTQSGVPPTQSGVPPTQGGEPPSEPTTRMGLPEEDPTRMGLPEEDLTSNPGAAPEVAPGTAGPPVPSTVPPTVPPTDKPDAQSGGFMEMLSGLGNDERVAAFGNTIDPILTAIGNASGQGPDFAQKINPLMKILMMAGGGLGIGGLLGGGKKMGMSGLAMMAIPLIYQILQGKKNEGAAAGAGTAAGTAAAGTAAGGKAPTGQEVQELTATEQARHAAAQQTIGDMATNPKTKGIVASFGTTKGESGQPNVFDSPEDVSALIKGHAFSGKPSAQEVNTLISNLSPAGKASLADQIQSKWDKLGEFGQNFAGPKIPKLLSSLREGTSYTN